MPDRLFDVEPKKRRPRWRGSLALVWIGRTCPAGHGALMATTSSQAAIFRLYGAGATERTTWWVCPTCFWSPPPQSDAVRDDIPDRLPS